MKLGSGLPLVLQAFFCVSSQIVSYIIFNSSAFIEEAPCNFNYELPYCRYASCVVEQLCRIYIARYILYVNISLIDML